jgi:hypothetical protein
VKATQLGVPTSIREDIMGMDERERYVMQRMLG